MSFFEDVGDAFESNAGWFMLANMVNTNRIASAQTTIAQDQKDATAESHRLEERKLALLEKDSKAAQQERKSRRKQEVLELERRNNEALNLKKFRASLAYCQLLLEQNNEWGFELATLDILTPSLKAIIDVSTPSVEELQAFERFTSKYNVARRLYLANEGSNSCFSAAIRQLDRWRDSLRKLQTISDELISSIQRWTSTIYRSTENRSLLQFALHISETPLRHLQPSEPTVAVAQAKLTDRQGLMRCTQEDWNHVHDKCKEVNLALVDEMNSTHASIQQQRDKFFEANRWLHIRKTCHTTSQKHLLKVETKDVLSTLASAPHYSTIGLVDSLQSFLGIMEQVKAAKKAKPTGVEYAGFLAVSSKALPFFDGFVSQLASTNKALEQLGWGLLATELLANSQLTNCFQEGISRLMYLNQETLERQMEASAALKEQRLASFRKRQGTENNSRFDRVRQSRPLPSKAHLASQEDRNSVTASSFSDACSDLANFTAWILSGNLSEVELQLDQLRTIEGFTSDDEIQLKETIRTVSGRWNKIESLHGSAIQSYTHAISVKGKISFLKDGTHHQLEAALRAFYEGATESGFAVGSELRSRLELKIAELQPAFELTGMCFSWSATALPLEDSLTHIQAAAISPHEAYINALCAMASADGDFCSQERWAVKKCAMEARLPIDSSCIGSTIDQWCSMARDHSLQHRIAQSVVDVRSIRETPLAAKLIQGLSTVLRADGRTTTAETQLFKQIAKQLT